jgi:hypothetical protein
MAAGKRQHNRPWRGLYGTDRRYTARVDRAIARGAFTEPGTQPNPTNVDKVARKKRAKKEASK